MDQNQNPFSSEYVVYKLKPYLYDAMIRMIDYFCGFFPDLIDTSILQPLLGYFTTDNMDTKINISRTLCKFLLTKIHHEWFQEKILYCDHEIDNYIILRLSINISVLLPIKKFTTILGTKIDREFVVTKIIEHIPHSQCIKYNTHIKIFLALNSHEFKFAD